MNVILLSSLAGRLAQSLRQYLASRAVTPEQRYLESAVDLVDLENRMRALNR